MVRVTFGLGWQKTESDPGPIDAINFTRLVKPGVVGRFCDSFLLLRDILKGILMKHFSNKDKKEGTWMETIGKKKWTHLGSRCG